MQPLLTPSNHDRRIAGLKYIYPVISRRAGGLSIGVNFNTNNACNWRCIYCQVPDLKAGNAPEMDFDLLAEELRYFLDEVLHGDFFRQYQLEPHLQSIKDIAISGNGEPTSLKSFAKAAVLIAEIATEFGIFPAAKFVLISNGSLIHQLEVQKGLQIMANFNGELWFKLDSATESGRKLINNTGQNQKKLIDHLQIASSLIPTRLQTCMLHFQNQLWTQNEKQAYLTLLKTLQDKHIVLQSIMLYSIARQSLQPEAEQLSNPCIEEMQAFAEDIKALGLTVSVNV
jgi:wyosine [tRNA(Phe)-imidazoG37] synthetase (radical SAM superfamily)